MKSTRLSLALPSWRNFSICGADTAVVVEEPQQQGGTSTGGAGGASEGDKPKDTGGDPQKKIADLEEEKDRHYRARQQAETELNELRTYKQEAEKAKLTADERTAQELKEARTATAEAQDTIRRLAIENAFLSSNTVKWHSAANALKLADLSEVKVEDGVVKNPDALKSAIEKLSKESPYLVAGDAPNEQPKPQPVKTGEQPKSPVPGQGQDKATLEKKYPGLRTH